MFTGIIEALGTLETAEREGSNAHFWISSPFTNELKVDQSIAHDGVCLTVVGFEKDQFQVTAIDETLARTTLSTWNEGQKINLERCMTAGGRFDGHIVQGHVDQTAQVSHIEELDGSRNYHFTFESSDSAFVVSKGSITVNGTSLTVVNASANSFSVSIIPYTYEHTNFKQLKEGDLVNIEFDILGKYVMEAQRRLQAS